MIQGTASYVGKSVITAAFCRLFARMGYRVAPFKAQNMSNNAFVTKNGGEIGRAQAFQAQAAGVQPHVDMNPVLLKPEADTRSQVIVLGQAVGRMDVRRYHDYQPEAWETICMALDRLREAYDLIIIEGAGSPAEINLREHDIVNMKVAAYARSPVLLVGDIERGGVFASLIGTFELLDPAEQGLVKGFLINKFRGESSILDAGLTFLEERTCVPVLGVLPFVFGLPVDEEDAVNIGCNPFPQEKCISDANILDASIADANILEANIKNYGIIDAGVLDIGVIHLPHIANATDFAPLAQEPDVSVRYIAAAGTFGVPDVVIIPGTKSTMADFEWMRTQGLAEKVVRHASKGGWLIGICGGYQMLGLELRDPEAVESKHGAISGLGILPVVTNFKTGKDLTQVEAVCMMSSLEGAQVRGYEIHQGRTCADGKVASAFRLVRRFGQVINDFEGASLGPRLFGTYLHGLFDHGGFRRAYINAVRVSKGLNPLPGHAYDARPKNFDQLADWLLDSVDIDRLSALIDLSACG